MVDAVLAGAGIERIAQLAADQLGRAIAIVAPSESLAVVWPPTASRDPLPSLRRYLSASLNGRAANTPSGVELVVPVNSGHDIVGVVAMLSAEGPSPAEAKEFLHLAALTTVTALALEQARDHEEGLFGGGLIERLRSEDMDGDEIARRAGRLGCELAGGAVVVVTEVHSSRPRQAMALIAADHPGAISELLDGRIYAVLPANGDERPESTVAAAATLAERLRSYGHTGLSSFCTDPSELRRAIQEAELVLEVVSKDERMAEQLSGGAGSGVYRLLFRALASHPEEVRNFYEDTVAAVVLYDHQYHTELLATLEAYLANDCNMNATGRAIYAHRHTVAYRLSRVRELTGLDPSVGEDRERLGLGLKAYRIVAPTLPR
jgi:sugar diacid utilization regulator